MRHGRRSATGKRGGKRRGKGLLERLEPRRLLTSSAYTYQPAAIGAGGFVDGVFYDPNPADKNVIYARTDIGGLWKTTNDGANWTQLLNNVGNNTADSGNGTFWGEMGVLAFAIDPNNAANNTNNVYALVGNTGSTADGAFLSSTNGGQTWTATSLSFAVNGNSNGRGDGERIAVDPNNSSVIYIGSNAGIGVWRSTNSGASFTKLTGISSSAQITFIVIPSNSQSSQQSTTVVGGVTMSSDVYIGIDSSTAGNNLDESVNGGTNFTLITGTGSLPTSKQIPGHAEFSGGDLYIGYGNGLTPNTTLTAGGVFRYAPGTTAANGTWANITPVTGSFGYDAVAVDPENPNVLVVTSMDDYSGPDQIWRTTTAAGPTTTWTELYDYASAQNSGYGGFDNTRNTSSAPWIAAFGDGISNWAATVAINPFNSNQLMYGTGQGIWATNNASNGGFNTQLTGANSWYFPDTGIEFTAVLKLAAPSAGAPLLSVVGDIDGFEHTTLTSSPAAGALTPGGYLGNDTGIDFAQDNPNDLVYVSSGGTVGSTLTYGAYSTSDGATWTQFAANSAGSGSGTVAMSANGGTIIWAPSGQLPYYSTNDGTTWTASTMPAGTATGGTVVSDRVNSNDLYYWTENSQDNSWQLYMSTNGGQSFTADGAAMGIGNVTLVPNPNVAGDLWMSNYNGIYHSTNFGANFTQNSVIGFANVFTMALGAPAPGQSYPAIYMYGLLNGFEGFYRSDDQGATWTLLNNVNEQFGGQIDQMAADPNVFGRYYFGTNGQGITVGNPASSLPVNWSDADINTPGNPGWATNSTTLSNGNVASTNWIIDGGGAGLGGTTDQFNFAYEPVTGNVAMSTQLLGLTNADIGGNTPSAGVMVRASTNNNDPFAAILQNGNNQLVFEYRTTTGGSVTTSTLGSVPVGAEYLELVRNGNNFSGMYSTNGINWTQLGSTINIAAMPATANAGLAASADYNPQLTQATFTNPTISFGPAVVNVASATPAPVTGTTTQLSALGSDAAGASSLTYTWSATSVPLGVTTPTFTANGTNAAQATTAKFFGAGSYQFQVTIADGAGLSVSSTVNVTVDSTLSSLVLSPATANVPANGTKQFAVVSGADQFNTAVTLSAGQIQSATWTASGTNNSISSTGLLTLKNTHGNCLVTATIGGVNGTAIVTPQLVAQTPPTVPPVQTAPLSPGGGGGGVITSPAVPVTALPIATVPVSAPVVTTAPVTTPVVATPPVKPVAATGSIVTTAGPSLLVLPPQDAATTSPASLGADLLGSKNWRAFMGLAAIAWHGAGWGW